MIFYYLTIAIQVYCIYHLFKNGKPIYWIFVILFLPLLGSVVYLITQVYNRKDAEMIQSNVTQFINPTKKIKDLEKQLEFSDSYGNRMNLADAYFEIGDYQQAIPHYEEMLKNKLQNEFFPRRQLVICFSKLEEYDAVIANAERIKNNQEFRRSTSEFYYGHALYKSGKTKEAEAHLQSIDRPFSNYEERLELAKFYLDSNQNEKAKALLEEMASEADYMTKPNKKLFRSVINEVYKLLKNNF
jgi:FimV-like protein